MLPKIASVMLIVPTLVPVVGPVVVAGAEDHIGPLAQHFLARFGAFGAIGLGVGEHGLDLAAEQTALGVDVIHEHLRHLGAVVVVGRKRPRHRDGKSKDDVVGRLRRLDDARR